jgi:Cu(I)/Ag(I) efflux system membrane fusion protein
LRSVRRHSNHTDIKLAYCPMAFDNRGAEWIQRGDKIDNSYFGSNMLLCGEFRQTIPTGTHIAPKE